MHNISLKSNSKVATSYLGLFFVVFIWGCSPLVTFEFYKYYSPTFRAFFAELIIIPTYLIISSKHFKEFSIDYIKIGVPTGIFLALANISQKIGLLYTTPAKYAFLENLSCITVPIFMYIFVRKKPTYATILSCTMALVGVFILNGISFSDGTSWGIGEILCSISGLLYGVNIAGTGAYAKKLYPPLYLAVQSTIAMIISFIFAIILNFATYTNSVGMVVPIEKIVFSFKPEHIIFTCVWVVISSAMCWIIRTEAMKHIDATSVAVIMPFSAVITAILSVITGNDALNINIILGGTIGILAIFLSSYDDIFKRKTK